jgi:hypothetical protein
MVPSSLTSYISLMRCVSYAVSPTNTITPITNIAQFSELLVNTWPQVDKS